MPFRPMGFLLLLNSPKQMQFGIDNQYWTTGNQFMGVKLIPQGAHFIYFALKDEEEKARSHLAFSKILHNLFLPQLLLSQTRTQTALASLPNGLTERSGVRERERAGTDTNQDLSKISKTF